ncbi:hypothetical protein B0H16DRAFT_1341846 [Mycena metata]|uniref:Uncharacterized protein n=1 Tax=Mycena metata TaxID=1033252 RepID=A0AAD7H5N6_9AGAR|nr:hypothetical protein B0H16DRAFT_1341846 [Mycena metata]
MTGASAAEAFDGLPRDVKLANEIAALVWSATKYRFVYKKKAASRTTDTVITYTYFCAQNEKEVTKTRLVDDQRKRRARMKMERFPCNGWLHVTIDSEHPEHVRLRVQHHRVHCHYVDISLSEDITKLLFLSPFRSRMAANADRIQIWTRVLQDYPGTEVTQKQIYALWSRMNEEAWRLDDDQVKSAQKLLEKMHGKEIEIIPIRQEEGLHCIAFGFKEVLDGWAEQNEELAMDSTCKIMIIDFL